MTAEPQQKPDIQTYQNTDGQYNPVQFLNTPSFRTNNMWGGIDAACSSQKKSVKSSLEHSSNILKPHFLKVPPYIRQSLHLHLGLANCLLP